MRRRVRRRVALPILTVLAVVTSLFVAVQPASAHGYISSPPSRQAQCAHCGNDLLRPRL